MSRRPRAISSGLLGIVGDGLLEFKPVNDLLMLKAIGFLSGAIIFLDRPRRDRALRDKLLIGTIAPATEHIGNIVLGHALAFVVQRKPIVLHVVEPDLLRLRALGEEENGGGDAGVGSENAGGHRDDAVETVFLDELLADIDVGVGGAKQHAVGNDDGGAAAILEQAQEEVQEQDLGLLDLGRQRRVYVARVDRAFEWRIGENNVVAALFGESLGKSIGVMKVRSGEAVEHEVHAADPEHGHAGVGVEAGKGLGLAEFPFVWREFAAGQAVGLALLVVGEVARVGVGFKEVLPGIDEEAAGAGGRVDDALAGLRIEHLTIMRMMWRGVRNWPFCASGIELAEKVFVEIALHVLVLRRDLHGVDGLAGFDKQAGLVDLELGVLHVLAERARLRAEGLEERKDLLLHDADGLVAGKLGPIGPA